MTAQKNRQPMMRSRNEVRSRYRYGGFARGTLCWVGGANRYHEARETEVLAPYRTNYSFRANG